MNGKQRMIVQKQQCSCDDLKNLHKSHKKASCFEGRYKVIHGLCGWRDRDFF